MRARSPRRVVTGLVALTILATGCTGDETPSPDPGANPSAAAPSAGPGEAAQSYPVPADIEATPLPDLGSMTARNLTFTLNAVRRTSDDAVLVQGTLTADGSANLDDLAEPGFQVRDVEGQRVFTYEFSAVTLRAGEDPQLYLPLRDEKGSCACTQGIQALVGGSSLGVYTYVSAPADASSVTLAVGPFGTFEGVAVEQ